MTASNGPDERIFSVGEVTAYIRDLFEYDDILGHVTIRGEVSNYKRHHSGHCYFSLKDANASIRCVMFRSRVQQLNFEPENGLQLLAFGRITVFERDGSYQLYVDRLAEDGAGALQAAFEALKEKLSREGLFEESRKKTIPLVPQSVGVITSPTGAAVRDVFSVAKRRHSGIPLLLYPVAVQGIEAPAQIAAAIRDMDRRSIAEVIIIGRGGGSIEELWAFNDERVVRAVAECQTPIISAVGHQTDYTLSDFAADVRAATPSQAAELAVPDLNALLARLRSNEKRLVQSLRHVLARHRLRLERCLASKLFKIPENLVSSRMILVDRCRERLFDAANRIVQNSSSRWLLASQKLDLLNPMAVLHRGYALVRTPEGNLVSRISQTGPGNRLEIHVSDGHVNVVVTDVKEREGNG